MPFIAAIGAAVTSFVGAAVSTSLGLALASIGAGVVGVATVVVGGALANKLIKSLYEMPQIDSDAARQRTVRSTVEPQKIIYGEALVSGPVTFIGVYGSNNRVLAHAVALAGHEVNAITDVHFDNEVISSASINGSGFVTTGAFGPVGGTQFTEQGINFGLNICKIDKHLGGVGQVVDPSLNSAFGSIDTSHKGTGIAYISTHWLLKDASQEVWDKYTPQNIMAVVQGKKVYDPRQDSTSAYYDASVGVSTQRANDSTTWTYSTNPVWCLIDYMTDTSYGMSVSLSRFDLATAVTAADSCDELVSGDYATPSGSQKRFTCNGILFATDTHKTNINKILSAMNGMLTYTNGQFVVRAGAYEAPSVSLNEDNLAGAISVKTSVERSDRFNTVTGTFIDPTQNHKATEFPEVYLTSARNRDNGEILTKNIQLPMTNDRYMAQRIAHKLIQQSDQQKVVTFPTNLSGMQVAVGDRVSISLAEFNWSNKVFICLGWTLSDSGNGGINLILREDDSGSYADPATAEYSEITATGTINEGFRGVPDPSNLSATAGLKSIELNWTNPDNMDGVLFVEVFASPNSSWSNRVKIGETNGTQFTHDASNAADAVAIGDTRYYWVRARAMSTGESAVAVSDTNPSGETSEITATVGALPWNDVVGDDKPEDNANNTYVDGNGAIQGVSSGAGTSIDNTLNAGKTIALLLNQQTNGITNNGEGCLVGVDNEGNIDRTKDGYILWNGSKITIERHQYGGTFTFLTGLEDKRGFICFDTAKLDQFTVQTVAVDVAFVFKIDQDWYYDNNTSAVGFTPTNDMVALGWIETGAADLIIRGGLFGEPVSLTTASFPSDVIKSGTIGGVKIGESSIYEGAGNFNDEYTGFYVDSSGRFSLKNKLSFDGDDLVVDGGIRATTLDVIDATITGALNASTISAGAVKVETLSQGVWNAIDERFVAVAGASGGFYEENNGIFVGSEITLATPQVAHNTKDIVFQIAIDQFWGSTTNYTGTALQAVLRYEYSTDNSTWNIITDGTNNAQTTLTATNTPFTYGGTTSYFYYLLSGYQFTMPYAQLAAGNYYFRVRITPSATPNAFQLSSYLAGGGIPVTYEANEAVSGTVSTSGNADTLDGLDSTQFLRSDADDSTSGSLSVGGNLTVSGDLTINGTTTTLNTATLQVEDKNIVLNYGAGDTSGSADGAGITIQDAVDSSTDATILWDSGNDEWDFSHHITATNFDIRKNVVTTSGNGVFDVSKTLLGNIHISNGAGSSGSPKEAAITFQGDNTSQAQAGIYVVNDNSSGTHMAFATTQSYATGPQNALTITNYGLVNFPRARPTYNGNGLWASSDFTSTDISNWNTAYGWGDHASAGYLTSVTATLDDVTSNGATTSNDIQVGHLGVDGASNASYPLYVHGHIAQSSGSIYAFGDFVMGLGGLKHGTTQIIDSNDNLANIGTISSGAITIYTQASTLEGINLVANVSSANQNSDSPKIQFNGEYQSNGPYIQGENVGSYGYKSLKFYTNRNSGTDYTTAPTVTLTLNSAGNVNINSGALQIGGTTVIDSSRNLTNIGTISSGDITSSGLTVDYTGNRTGDAGILVTNDASDWGIKVQKDSGADYGILSQTDGENAILVRNAAGVNKIQLQGDGDASFEGTISSGAITSTGSSSFGDVAIGGAADSNYDLKVYGLARFQGAANFVDATNPIQVGGTTVIDSSRNLTNIGTYSGAGDVVAQATNVMFHARSSADSQTVGFRAGYLDHSSLQAFFRYTTGDAQLYIDNDFAGNNGLYSNINFRNKANGGTSLVNRLTIHGSTGNVNITGGNLQMSGTTVIDSSRNAIFANTVSVGSTALNDQGVSIYSEASASGYGRIRFYENTSNTNTIHAFSTTWQNATFESASTGAINLSGYNGVTFGAWYDPSCYISNSGVLNAKDSLKINGTTVIDSSRNASFNSVAISETIEGGSGTAGHLILTDAYTSSNHLANIGWLRSSGGTYIAYGVKQSGSAAWQSTYDIFSGARSYVAFDEDSVTMAYAPAQQTAVGTEVTNLTEKFKFDLANGSFSVGGTTVIDSSRRIQNANSVSINTAFESGMGLLHIKASDSGAAPYQTGNEGIVVERNGRAAISLLSPANSSGYVFFSDPNNTTAGYVGYDHSVTALELKSEAKVKTYGTGLDVVQGTLDIAGTTVITGARNLTNIGYGIFNEYVQILNPNAAFNALDLGSSTQSNYTNIVIRSNSGNTQLWKQGTTVDGWGGASAFNIYNTNGIIALHPAGTANVLQVDSSGLNVGSGKDIRINSKQIISPDGGFAAIEDGRVTMPAGAHYTTSASSVSGAIKITLPRLRSNTMLRFTVKIYEYAGGDNGESCTIDIGGYNYSPGSWYNVFANVVGNTANDLRYTVRFGDDGSNSCVWIGETTGSWSYPQVFVTDVQAGYSGFENENWIKGWDIGFATSLGSVYYTIAANQIGKQCLSNFDAASLSIGNVSVINSSRNLTNIGTISSGAITCIGNLLAGKSVTTFATEGFFYENGKAVEVTTDSARVMRLNRTTDNGNILELNKDGVVIGSLGSEGGDSLYIGNGDTGIKFSGGANAIQPFDPATVTARNDAVDLGTSGARFKDLYLSGAAKIIGSNTGTSQIWLGDTDDNNRGTIVYDHTSDYMSFKVNGIERYRVDSSGNFLVGKTTAAFATQGAVINNNGSAEITKDGGATLFLNRKTSDGDIVAFYKDGTTVGSIGTASSYLTIGSPVGSGGHLLIGNNLVHPATSTGGAKDNAIDIGGSSNRFKDLYLSGYVKASSGYQVGTTTVIDSSRNLTNISTITTTNRVVIDSDHGNARLQLKYRHEGVEDSIYSGHLTLWASEPGVTYDNCGIGGNINANGHYYGRQINSNPYGVYLRFDVNNGYSEFWSTTGSAGSAGGEGGRIMLLDAGGNVTFSGNITAFSDERLKDNIKTLDGSKVLQMRGVSFTKDGKDGSGVIAQELEKVAPELVMTLDDRISTKSVAYGNLVGYLIEAVKMQQTQIDELKALIQTMMEKQNGNH